MNAMRHDLLGNVRYSSVQMPDSADGQVKQAIALMSRYAIEDSGTPQIIRDAQYAAGEARGDAVEGAYLYARRKIRFAEDRTIISDPSVVEVLIRPVDVSVMSETLGTGSVVGDCDDFSMYVAALLLAQGVPCCFATVAADPNTPNAYSHVYVVAYPGNGRIAVDASHGKHCGWECPNRFGKLREWDLFQSATSPGSSAGGVLAVLAAGAVGWWYYNKYGFDFGDKYND